MISRQNRFHGLGSLKYLFNGSKSVRSKNLIIKYKLNPRRKEYRLSIIVSKKVSKSAVVRNRIRRRIYECVRLISEGINDPYDIAIIVYSESLAKSDSSDLQQEVKDAFYKAKMI